MDCVVAGAQGFGKGSVFSLPCCAFSAPDPLQKSIKHSQVLNKQKTSNSIFDLRNKINCRGMLLGFNGRKINTSSNTQNI